MSEWISVKDQKVPRDRPVLIHTDNQEFPAVVEWLEEGTYGEPAFFENNYENYTKEEDILFWMPIPEVPKDGP